MSHHRWHVHKHDHTHILVVRGIPHSVRQVLSLSFTLYDYIPSQQANSCSHPHATFAIHCWVFLRKMSVLQRRIELQNSLIFLWSVLYGWYTQNFPLRKNGLGTLQACFRLSHQECIDFLSSVMVHCVLWCIIKIILSLLHDIRKRLCMYL